MEPKRCSAILLFFLWSLLAHSSSASSPISDGVFESHASIGRNLLQARKPCPVNFEFLNYTIITSRCKGPQYPPSTCCKAFKDFACPYTDVLNDLTNDCASTMFSYINLYGKYPPGLFASECRDGKQGLECPAFSPSSKLEADTSGNPSPSARHISLLPSFITCFVMVLHQLL